MARRLAVVFLIVVALAWSVSLVGAPLITNPVAAWLYAGGSLVCHQLPDRSFHAAGVQLPVCARCAALYWGGTVGLMAWVLIRAMSSGGHHFSGAETVGHHFSGAGSAAGAPTRTRFKRALVLCATPVAVSVATATLGIWDPPNALRAAISAPLGVVLGALVAAVVMEDLR